MSKKSVAVQIAGQEYKIRSDADPTSLRQIAGYVDRAMKRVREGTGTVDSLDVAVLTSLNLAREIIALREEKQDAINPERVRALIQQVESVSTSLTSAQREQMAAGRSQETSETDAVDRMEEAELESAGAARVGESEPPDAEVRTLDLPGMETLREEDAISKGGSSSTNAVENEPLVSERRAAAGDRSS